MSFWTRPSDRDQFWHACADRNGTGSHLNKIDHLTPGGGVRRLVDTNSDVILRNSTLYNSDVIMILRNYVTRRYGVMTSDGYTHTYIHTQIKRIGLVTK